MPASHAHVSHAHVRPTTASSSAHAPMKRPRSGLKPAARPIPSLVPFVRVRLSSAVLARLQALAEDREDSPEKLAAMLVEAGLDYLEGYPGESPNSSNINPVDNDFDDSEIIPWP